MPSYRVSSFDIEYEKHSSGGDRGAAWVYQSSVSYFSYRNNLFLVLLRSHDYKCRVRLYMFSKEMTKMKKCEPQWRIHASV